MESTLARDQPGLKMQTGLNMQIARLALCGLLIGWICWFVAATIHWPLVNDPAQIDYMCFLMDHGRAPYRDILEMNMPGIYMVNWTVMHTLGEGALAWRFFDFSLDAAMVLAMIAIAQPTDWLAGFFSGVLFALFHGRDGSAQAGQRDLIIAVLLVASCAFLFHAFRKNKVWPWFLFGVLSVGAATIKPTPLPFVLLLLVAAAIRQRRLGRPVGLPILAAVAGMAVPCLAVFAFLRHHGSVHAFVYTLRTVLPYYSELGRRGFWELLRDAGTPSLGMFLLLALAIAFLIPRWRDWESNVLLGGAVAGAFSYFAQGKTFPYQRYPMIAFIFLWAGLQFMLALRAPETARHPRALRVLGCLGLLFGLAVAPEYIVRAHNRQWGDGFIDSLSADLQNLGGPQLSGHVQCLYMPADCDTVLYRMKLIQATGLSYDFFIFGSGNRPVVQHFRRRFWQQFQQNPPSVIVVGKGLYPDDMFDYRKLDRWPKLRDYLKAHYSLYDARDFKPGQPGPRGFRVYVQKDLQLAVNNRPRNAPQSAAPEQKR